MRSTKKKIRNHEPLSRREFLELVGFAASAAALSSCAPTDSTPIPITATPTAEPPTPTPLPPPTVVGEPSGFEMVLVEVGSFQMGSAQGSPSERPVHTVNLSRSFLMARHEVTYEQYDLFCQDTGRQLLDDYGWGRETHPVSVTWYDATEYCNWLSAAAGLTPCYSGRRVATECDFAASGYRLPTEAEWEYAARGGSRSQGYICAGGNDADEIAWHQGNSDGRAWPVGQKAPNELGLYDLSGNMWEWCWDWFEGDYYASSPDTDPRGPDRPSNVTMAEKVRRGGSWYHEPDLLRPTYRSFDFAHYRSNAIGFRLVRTVQS